MSRLKVAIATHFPVDTEMPRHGVEAVSLNLVRALARLDDLEVHVITLDFGRTAATESAWQGAVIHRLPRHTSSELWNCSGPGRRQLQEYLRRLQPAVVHAHDGYGLMVKGLRLPRVLTIHGFIYQDTLLSRRKCAWLRSQLWRRAEIAAWADQPHLISINPYVRERLCGITTGLIHDIDNPVAETFFDLPRRERAGRVFSAATVSPGKNTLVLIDAVWQLARSGVDIELHLAGAVRDAAYGALVERSIAEKELQRSVVLLGQIGRDAVRRELAAAAVFALVSLQENSPLSIQEAMAAGVPVVTSNRCGMPYMVESCVTGYLVDPNDPTEIANRLRNLLASAALRRDFGHAARVIARQRFQPHCVAERTREVYRDAVATFAG